ncbi:MAG TPA: TDT family transporter [Mariprofundaceae bacterium]|nr:TDT family transporter [Mariprofundaceae bacterium]
MAKPLTHLEHPRELVRQFTPNWFTMNMGTGILSLLIAVFPYPFAGQHMLAESLWWADVVLFLVFSALFIARFLIFPGSIGPMLDHPVQSMFLGAIPMALVPIINGLPEFSSLHHPYAVAHVLWWLDVALAVISGLLVPYRMFTRQQHRLEGMTAIWLLPIVASEVTASSGGFLAPHLPAEAARLMLGVSGVLWSLSVPLAMGILVILFLRMACHSLPPREMAVSAWLTLGPIGTGALALVVLGQAAPAAFAGTPLQSLADAAKEVGIVLGFLLWAYGLWWWVTAWLITVRTARLGLPFNMGWWGFTFPVGVFAMATVKLAACTGALPLRLFAALLIVQLACFWMLVLVRTLPGMWRGQLFHAPCLLPETAPA